MAQSRRAVVWQAAAALAAILPARAAAFNEALATARATGKPPLTVVSLNALLRQLVDDPALMAQARADIPGFLRAHFALTSRQEQDVASLTPDDIRALRQALDTGARAGNIKSDCGAVARRPGDVAVRSEHFQVIAPQAGLRPGMQNMAGAGRPTVVIQLSGFGG